MALPTCPHIQIPHRAGSYGRCWGAGTGDPGAAPHSGVSPCGQGHTQPPAASPDSYPQHQATRARLCLYLLKSLQEGPQDLDQTAPSEATGEPGHRADVLVALPRDAGPRWRQRPSGRWPGSPGQLGEWLSHTPSPGEPLTAPARLGRRPAGWLRLPGGGDQEQRPTDRSAPSSRPADSSPLPYFAHTGGQIEKPEQEPAS